MSNAYNRLTPDAATLTLTLSGTPDALRLAQRVLMVISRLGHYGCSRDVVVPIDGDGPIRLDVDGITIPPFSRSAMEHATDKQQPRLGDFLEERQPEYQPAPAVVPTT